MTGQIRRRRSPAARVERLGRFTRSVRTYGCPESPERIRRPPKLRRARPHRRTPSSTLPRPQSTSPIAPPHPRAAHGQLLLAQNSPETLAAIESPPPTHLLASRRRYSSPRPRFRALEGAAWTPLAPTPLSPRRRRPPHRDLAGQPPLPSLTTTRDLPARIQRSPGCYMNSSRLK